MHLEHCFFIYISYHENVREYNTFSRYNRGVMLFEAETIQIIIQGGAVGLMLATLVMGYRIARLAIERVSTFINNHLAHNTEAIQEGTEVMREVKTEIIRMSERLNKD